MTHHAKHMIVETQKERQNKTKPKKQKKKNIETNK